MIQTASFYSPGLDRFDSRLVSIALYPPRWWGKRRRFLNLTPPKELLAAWKSGQLTVSVYADWYMRTRLSKLNPHLVILALSSPEAILCCWEKSGEFCHRRLVAEWLERETGHVVPEWEAEG